MEWQNPNFNTFPKVYTSMMIYESIYRYEYSKNKHLFLNSYNEFTNILYIWNSEKVFIDKVNLRE